MPLDLLINILDKTLLLKNYFLLNRNNSVFLLTTNGKYFLTKISLSLIK